MSMNQPPETICKVPIAAEYGINSSNTLVVRESEGTHSRQDRRKRGEQFVQDLKEKTSLLQKRQISDSSRDKILRQRTQLEYEKSGFKLDVVNNKVTCSQCQLSLIPTEENKHPVLIHNHKKPDSNYFPSETITSEYQHINFYKNTPTNTNQTIQSTDTSQKQQQVVSTMFVELKMIKKMRIRSFSKWLFEKHIAKTSLIDAGLFCCNVADRTICIYCHLICQNWQEASQTPYRIHAEKSPGCPFIMSTENWCSPQLMIMNDFFKNRPTINNGPSQDLIGTVDFVSGNASHPAYIGIAERIKSFAQWKDEKPTIDDFVKAGFFYSGINKTVTCFYCNGSLQNWSPDDNTITEHARWFPHCGYAKQMCGEDLYRRIQESKLNHQEKMKKTKMEFNSTQDKLNNGKKLDDALLSRYVAARLDLFITQMQIDRGVKVTILKRCWEDQIRMKQTDFEFLIDLVMARIILEKQVQYISGNKDKILSFPDKHATNDPSDLCKVGKDRAELTNEQKEFERQREESRTCLICSVQEREIVFLPCGHCATCVACGHSIRSCVACRANITGFFRIYI